MRMLIPGKSDELDDTAFLNSDVAKAARGEAEHSDGKPVKSRRATHNFLGFTRHVNHIGEQIRVSWHSKTCAKDLTPTSAHDVLRETS